MKKILLSILTVLLLALCVMTAWKGINVFGMDVIGISQIQEKNDKLDETIEEATKLASTDYENALAKIKDDVKKLEDEKATYEELLAANTTYNEEGQAVTQSQTYKIEYLWTKIGNHATSEGIELKMDLVSSGMEQDVYNLNFTIRGSYIGLADFISTIENDSELGFKIENFSMVPGGSTDNLQATFTCKNIKIELSEKKSSTNTDVTPIEVVPAQTTSDGTETTEN